MDFFILRNRTVEHLFNNYQVDYSGYDDISYINEDANSVIWFYQLKPTNSIEQHKQELTSYKNKIQFLFDNDTYTKNTIIIIPDFSNAESLIESDNLLELYNDFCSYIKDLAVRKRNIKYIYLNEFCSNYSKSNLIDWKFYYVSDMVIQPKLAKDFQTWFSVKLNSLKLIRKKCLILDCDNTLWGGVLGEDGIEGIKIGDTYPGKAFQDFQASIIELSKQGIILALCSKNNEEDVWEAFDKNPYMVLKREHISAHRINWQNKASNIMELADELNIGLDSMVFIDDNPAERAIVMQHIPELVVPNFPVHAYQLIPFFNEVCTHNFSIFKLTDEDKKKTDQYLQNAKRNVFKDNFLNMDDYLTSLEMYLQVYFANSHNIERIAQMTQKTNQFNLTTRRYTETDLKNFLERDSIISCVSIKDKFGDNGITVASILLFENAETVSIDSFLLSCRILGRGIEKAYIYYLLNMLFDRGVKLVKATFIPTKKNKQTEKFYDQLGFNIVSLQPDGTKLYELVLNEKFELKPYYNFLSNESK